MAWVGILTTGGGILVVVLACYGLLRVKHVQVKRILETLEWLFLQPRPGRKKRLAMSLQKVTETADRSQDVLDVPFREYARVVWNAAYRDLYWANRFADELESFSRVLVPDGERFLEEEDHERRDVILANHVQDFDRLAATILQLRRQHGREGQ